MIRQASNQSCERVNLTISCHAWLSWHTSWDENYFCTGQSFLQSIGIGLVASDDAFGVDVTNISSNT